MQETRSTCCYCGVGCGVIIESDAGRITGVRGDPAHPANFGRLCTKGSTLHLSARPEGRVLYPELRLERSNLRRQAGWDEALDHAAQRLAEIIRMHGPDSVAFYVSGQLLTEDYYVFNKLVKGLIGTNNIDSNSRLCMSSAVAGYKATLGMDAPPACYEDVDHAGCLFIAGSNTTYAHPVLFRRIEDARARNPDVKVIVVDPRHTDTARHADLHLPIQPGTDVALFNGMLHALLWEGLADLEFIRDHTANFDALKATLRDYTPGLAAEICGVPESDILRAARWFGAGPTLSLYCQGLNQSTSGTDKNTALINMHLATGHIGKPGTGPFSLTGQPNAMGGREVGGMANLLPAHRDLTNSAHRAEVARMWGVPSIPETPGKTAVELFDALHDGEIKAVWIAGTNPAQSMPHANKVREALRRADLVVVQEAFYHTDTVAYADILLPASTWGEKEGTVTNSERRISHVRAAVPAPGTARHDWAIATDFGQRLAARLDREEAGCRLLPYTDPETIFNEHRAMTSGTDLDITGLSYARLDAWGPQQWPFPQGARHGLPRLYENGVFPTPDGRASFANVRYKPPAEKTDARYPLRLNTGRLRDQWHSMSRSGNVAQLCNHAAAPVLSMHRSDMERRGIQDGDLVKISSRRGTLVTRVQASETVRPSQVFFPMHWSGQNTSSGSVNALTLPEFDPISRQPEFKQTALRVEKLHWPWRMVLMRRGAQAVAMMHALQPYLSRFDYACCGLLGRGDGVVIMEAAHENPPEPALIEMLDGLLQLTEDTPCLSYRNPRLGISKRLVVEENRVTGVRLVGETLAADWLKEVVINGEFTEEIRRWALAPVSAPPTGKQGRGRIVCSCVDVSEMEILAAVKRGAGPEELQGTLKCGTQCGSCVPELRQICRQALTGAPQ